LAAEMEVQNTAKIAKSKNVKYASAAAAFKVANALPFLKYRY
jgi:hypothetical protein